MYIPIVTITLQEELRQTRPFARKSGEALVAILRTATVLESTQNEVLRPHGITQTQYNVLRILQGAGRDGLCGKEVAERLVSRVPDVSRLLDRMVEMGLVNRERDSDDRRHVTARISVKGKRVLHQATPDLETVEQRLFRGMAASTVETLVTALARIRESA